MVARLTSDLSIQSEVLELILVSVPFVIFSRVFVLLTG